MKTLYKKSLIIHWATLLCFFLPFFHYSGCSSAKEKMEKEEALLLSDSIIIIDSLSNSLLDTTISESPTIDSNESENTVVNAPADESILKKLLYPKTDYYTGIGEVCSEFIYVRFYFVSISFLLLLINLIVKYLDKDARKSIVFLNILSFILVYFAEPPSDGLVEKLWGYWVCLIFLGVLSIYDLYIVRKQKSRL